MPFKRLACAMAIVLAAGGIVPAQSALPSVIPIFPLEVPTLFPGVSRPLYIFEPRYRAMVADALKGDRIIGMTTLKPGFEANYAGRPPIYEVGCAGDHRRSRGDARRTIQDYSPGAREVSCLGRRRQPPLPARARGCRT